MTAEQAEIAGMEVNALEKTMWASRVWTFQEASLSGRTVFVGSSVVKSAAELVVANILDQFRDKRSHLLYKGVEINEADDGFVHAVWRRKADGGTKITGGNSQECSIASATQLLRDRVVLDETYAGTEYDYIDEIWRRSGQRHCTKEEDRVYGMLGLVRHGNTMTVEYGIGFEEAVRRAAKEGLISQGVFLAATKSTKPGRSWCPAPGAEGWFRKGNWSVTSQGTFFKKIQLTEKGLWMVQGAKCQPCDPESIKLPLAQFLFENGREYVIRFRGDVPKDVRWRGDWLAVIERESRRDVTIMYATLIKYKIGEGERLDKLEAFGVTIQAVIGELYPEKEIAVGNFLLGYEAPVESAYMLNRAQRY